MKSGAAIKTHGCQRGSVFPITSKTDTVATHTIASTATPASSVMASTPASSAEGRETREGKRFNLPKQFPNQPPKIHSQHNPTHPITSVNIEKLGPLLAGFHKQDYIIDGFRNGFKIHFEGDNSPVHTNNSQAASEDHLTDHHCLTSRPAPCLLERSLHLGHIDSSTTCQHPMMNGQSTLTSRRSTLLCNMLDCRMP